MNFLKVALNSANATSKIVRHNQGAAVSRLRCFPRYLSMEAQVPTQNEPPPLPSFQSPSSTDTFPRNPSDGLLYGRLLGISWHTTKTDVLNMMDACKLSEDDIKVAYDRNYIPTEMIIQFPSRQAFGDAIRSIRGNGQMYRLDETSRSQWDFVRPSDGKAILLLGIPRNAQMDDIDRFLSGTVHDSSSIIFFNRQTFPDNIRVALVRFPSRATAMHAFITKNLGYCLNDKIWIQVLH